MSRFASGPPHAEASRRDRAAPPRRLLRAAARRVAEAWRRRAERRALEGLDDTRLDDIGLTRAELRAYLAGSPAPDRFRRPQAQALCAAGAGAGGPSGSAA